MKRRTRATIALTILSGAAAFMACVSDEGNSVGVGGDASDDGASNGDTSMSGVDGAALGDGGGANDAQNAADAFGGPPGDPVALAVGLGHACVLRRDAKVVCWGDNGHGQVGVNGGYPVSAPVLVTFPAATPAIVPVAIRAAGNVSCVEDDHARIWCWGADYFNQLGDGTNAQHPDGSTTAVQVVTEAGSPLIAKPGPPTLVYGGESSTGCAITSGNFLSCWGYDNFGQAGLDGAVSVPAAMQQSFLPPVLMAATGGAHTCAVDMSTGSQRVGCIGDNTYGELGVTGAPGFATPAYPSLGALDASSFQQIAAGSGHVCVLDQGSRLVCWGTNTMGQCGVNGPQSVLPTVNPDFTNPQNPLVQISLGYHLTCGVVQSGSVFCLGENTHAELSGLAGLDNNVHSTRVQVRDIDDAVSVGTGDFFACALRKSDGAGGGPSVFCWGDNTTAQLGTIEAGAPGTFNAQTIYTSYEPVKVPLP